MVFLPSAYAFAAQTDRSAADASAYAPVVDGQVITSAPAAQPTALQTGPQVLPLGTPHPADLLVIAPTTMPTAALAAISKLPGVSAVNLVDAARIKVNGSFVATLGVDPSTFRAITATPTAASPSPISWVSKRICRSAVP
jgi:hypothetical protein